MGNKLLALSNILNLSDCEEISCLFKYVYTHRDARGTEIFA